MKVWDEVYHRIGPTPKEKMIILAIKKDSAGNKVTCRVYSSRQKELIEKEFFEKELILVSEYLKPYKNTKEEVEWLKDTITALRASLKRAEQRLQTESKSK